MSFYAFEGDPSCSSTAYVHPSAVVIGDVIIGERFVGPNASLRGDYGRLIIEKVRIFRTVALCMAIVMLKRLSMSADT